MSDKFLGQLMMASFGFAPRGFAMCNGQFLPINQNQALFALLGTNYGGNGQTTVALPDLRSRTPLGYASSVDPGWPGGVVAIGERAGVESVTLTQAQMAAHTHAQNASSQPGNNRLATNRIFAQSTSATTPVKIYGPDSGPLVAMNPAAITNTGGGQPHTNLQPYSATTFCIALQGIFPSRN